jgi:hypothetical protein
MKLVLRGEKEMIDETAGSNAFSQMLSVAKSIKDMNDMRSEAISKLWGQIIATQERYAAAVAQIRELEGELAKLKDWKAERERYQLCDLGKCILGVAWNHGMSNDERYNSKCHDGAANEHGLVLKTKKGGPPARTWIPDFDF